MLNAYMLKHRLQFQTLYNFVDLVVHFIIFTVNSENPYSEILIDMHYFDLTFLLECTHSPHFHIAFSCIVPKNGLHKYNHPKKINTIMIV